MNSYQLIPLLERVENAKRINRDAVANIVRQHDYLVQDLVYKVFDIDDKLSIRASWILEWITTHYSLNLLLPHLDLFCESLHLLTFDSAIRPCAKVCEQLAVTYFDKQDHHVKARLNSTHIDQIIEVGFDWLITPQKIAVRAYTMQTLFLFGQERDWIHPELEHLIRTKIIHESKGCKARGRKVLELIEKDRKRNS